MMAYRYKIFLLIAGAVFFVDQFTKFLVLKYIPLGDPVSVWSGFFDLIHVRNTGAAFGMLANLAPNVRVPFFYSISALAVIFLFFAIRQLSPEDRFYPFVLGLITGGVFGNLTDRIRFGSVVDFLSFHVQDKILWGVKLEWPAFNVADSAITISMILVLAHMLRTKN